MLIADMPADLPVQPVQISMTAEQLSLPGTEKMGVIGAHYLLDVTPRFSGGLSAFGAVTGQRGGFFSLGVTGEYHYKRGPWQLESGLFVGGGGGGPGWTGSGLMLRPYVGVNYDLGNMALGLGVSNVTFPDGEESSNQLYATVKWNTSSFMGANGGGDALFSNALAQQSVPTEFAAMTGIYRMYAGSVHKDGSGPASDMHYAGFVYRRGLSGQVFGASPYWLLSTAGAAGGEYDGYAELGSGLGLQYALPFYPALRLRGEVVAGMAGAGSAVDTGGGVIGKWLVGASTQLHPDLGLSFSAGSLNSRGRFKAHEARVELAFTGWDIVPQSIQSTLSLPKRLVWAPWEVSAGISHFPTMLRKNGETAALDVMAFRFYRDGAYGLSVFGQAATAVNGKAGGYAVGSVGGGWLAPALPWGKARVGAEASLGAAGGGLVQVGGGGIAQTEMFIRYPVSRDWSVQANAGWFGSLKGELSSPLYGLNLVYGFSRLEGRATVK